MRYIALLRAVNVSGQPVKMDQLRALFSELGYDNVRSFIQSGNVFFDTDAGDESALTQAIEGRLLNALGFAVPVCLRTIAELERTLTRDPCRGETITPDTRRAVVFGTEPMPVTLELPAWSAKRDLEIRQVTEREAFVVWYLKDGRPPASDAFLKKTLGGPLTSRFLHTTVKILEAAKA